MPDSYRLTALPPPRHRVGLFWRASAKGGRWPAANIRVRGVAELDGEVLAVIETSAERVGCSGCGLAGVAEAQDRLAVEIREWRASGGRPVAVAPLK